MIYDIHILVVFLHAFLHFPILVLSVSGLLTKELLFPDGSRLSGLWTLPGLTHFAAAHCHGLSTGDSPVTHKGKGPTSHVWGICTVFLWGQSFEVPKTSILLLIFLIFLQFSYCFLTVFTVKKTTVFLSYCRFFWFCLLFFVLPICFSILAQHFRGRWRPFCISARILEVDRRRCRRHPWGSWEALAVSFSSACEWEWLALYIDFQ